MTSEIPLLLPWSDHARLTKFVSGGNVLRFASGSGVYAQYVNTGLGTTNLQLRVRRICAPTYRAFLISAYAYWGDRCRLLLSVRSEYEE